MPATLKQPRPRTLNPRPTKRPREATPIYITSASVMSTMLTLNFDQPVQLSGLPAFTTDVAGPVPVSATRNTPTRVAIIFSSSINGATRINLPFRDPAIRNLSGGYVTSNRVAL